MECRGTILIHTGKPAVDLIACSIELSTEKTVHVISSFPLPPTPCVIDTDWKYSVPWCKKKTIKNSDNCTRVEPETSVDITLRARVTLDALDEIVLRSDEAVLILVF